MEMKPSISAAYKLPSRFKCYTGQTKLFSNSPAFHLHLHLHPIQAQNQKCLDQVVESKTVCNPFAANLAAASSGVSKANLLLHLRAHLTIEFNPRAHISAQSKAASIITMFVSKLASLARRAISTTTSEATLVPISHTASEFLLYPFDICKII
ncbi:hypothetical protein G2W53_013201 [Senna tora]|uniref:Uncharacterized protein n=1 Tax=Senna tora TaxID=362788 RepID=A0A834WR45_9FABA|nr:hypothetical protein G2W53_013201 [Senna tora]